MTLSRTQRWLMPLPLVAILLVALWRWWFPAAPLHQRLFDTHLAPYQPQLGHLVGEALATVRHAYTHDQEAQAIALSLTHLAQADSLPSDTEAELTLALANFNLRQGHPDLARTRLLSLGPPPSPRQQAERQWMLALSHLAEANLPAAQRALQALLDDDVPHHDQAAQAMQDQLAQYAPPKSGE